MPGERLQFADGALQVILDRLQERALEELGFGVKFAWPEDMDWEAPTILVIPEKALSDAQNEKLNQWMASRLGAKSPSFWDRIRRDSGV